MAKDKLETTNEDNINICFNCVNYSVDSEMCKLKDKQLHPTQSCINFDINTEKELKTQEEFREEVKTTILKQKIYALMLQKEKSKATELIVKEFVEVNHIKVTRDDNKPEFYIYKEGIYIPEGRTYIEEFSRKALGVAHSTQLVNDVISKIQADYKVEFDEFLNTNYEYEIPVQNGILNLKTGNLKAFNSEKYFFNKLPITYDPNADCPKIKQFLEEITGNKEDVKLIFEIFGFCLVKEIFLEQTFMFVGDGSNGKSQLLQLFKRFIGINNVCSVTLQQMKPDDSGLIELHNKMLNLAGDLDNTALKTTGIFKELSGGDLVQAKRKFKRDLAFQSFCKMIFACNELPRVYDTSKGFWRRWILINFPYEFVDRERYKTLTGDDLKNKKVKEPKIIEKILDENELSGLLNNSLKALKQIHENKKFGYSNTAEQVKLLWLRKADSFLAYCLDNVKEEYTGRILKKDLKLAFHKYRREHKLKSVSDMSIKRTLEDEFGVSDVRNDSGVYWEGISFKEI